MTYISAELRRLVTERAGGCCEYCRVSKEDRLISYEIDHIIAVKHNGSTEADNLCFCCYQCNGFKGSDIASVDPETRQPAFLFNPRKHRWEDHFRLNGAVIEPLTPEGKATAFLLRFNMPERVEERETLRVLGSYPCTP